MRGSRWPLIEATSACKTHLEEAAQSLVAEIVEAQVLRRERDSRLQHSTQLNFPAILASVFARQSAVPCLGNPRNE